MNTSEVTVIEIVDDTAALSFVDLLACTQVEQTFVIELVDMGLLEPEGPAIEQWRFASRDLRRLRSAQRLVNDLGVNLAGAAVILELIEQRDALLRRLQMFDQ
jgi:chaperone modulatory protein CbpM